MDLKETILKALSFYNKMVDFDELAEDIKSPRAVSDVREAVKELIGEGKILTSKKGKMFLPGAFGFFTGRLDVKRMGFAFLPDVAGDIFIPADKKKGALHDDTVVVRLLSSAESDRKREGEVVRIIETESRTVIGTVQDRFVIPDDDRIDDIFIPRELKGEAVDGQKVVVRLTRRATKEFGPEGRVTEILGRAGDRDAEMKSVIKRFHLPESFPDGAEEEAAEAAQTTLDFDGREDFRKSTVLTIDGEDAKDLDDAVSLRKFEDGYELGVHIADVAHYVREGSALDKEAFARGTSVYLADRVIPMLPIALSNGICSLSEGQDRLTLSCVMHIDGSGRIIKSRICQSVIKSKHRLTYTDVNAIFEGDPKQLEKYGDILGDLTEMNALAKKLRERRQEKGSIDFELEETAFLFDEKGKVADLGPRQRGDAERLIEEFMLAANMTVAEEYYWREIPFVYRVHEQPDDEKMKAFAVFYSNFGKIKGKIDHIHPKVLQNILKDVKDTPHENIVAQIMLRSLKKAEYSPECKGHFGLSFPYYCHFTSPIRRYPDLAVHRIIKSDLGGQMTLKVVSALEEKVDDIARQSSQRERAAMEAERSVDDIKKAEFMLGKEGNTYDAVVSGVLKNVIFAELDNTVEGVLPLSFLKDDYYVYNEKLYCVIGEHTRRKISLGDEIKVRVVSVSVYPPRIEFEPVLVR